MGYEIEELENGEYVLVSDAIATILAVEKEIKIFKEWQDKYKARLLEQMEEYDIAKIDTPELTITRKAPTQRETFDSKSFKAANPDLYDEYVTFTDVKGSITIKLK